MNHCPSKETCSTQTCPFQNELPDSPLNGWVLSAVAFSFFIIPLLIALLATLIWDGSPLIQTISALGGFCLGGLLNWLAMKCITKMT